MVEPLPCNQEVVSSSLTLGSNYLGLHVPRLAMFPCKECVESSILLGSTIGLLVKVNNIIHDKETANSFDWPFLINKRFRLQLNICNGVVGSTPRLDSAEGRVRGSLYS